MKNTGAGSSSTGGAGHPTSNPDNTPPTQPPVTTAEESPRRRGATVNLAATSPQMSRPRPIVPRPPTMGRSGVSAFSAYTRPSPRPNWPAGGSGSSAGFDQGGFGYYGAGSQSTVPVGERGGYGAGAGTVAVAAGGALRIGGNPPAARKRVREGGAAAPAAGGNQQGEGRGNLFICSICGREFLSSKALFGHMRSHPNRGWKGAHPPPAFRPEVEFADVPGLNRPAVAGVPPNEGMEIEQAPAPAIEGTGETEDYQTQGQAGEGRGEEAAAEPGDDVNYRVPDLNNPPPTSDADE